MAKQVVAEAEVDTVEIHPLVLLSVSDHYNRVAKGTKKRVVGCLLGSRDGRTVTVANSFAVPFDEETRPPATWFLDYNYLEDLAHMFKRVNADEKIVGWYSTGPKLKQNDIEIHKLFLDYTAAPVLVIIKVTEETEDLPTSSYVAVDIVQSDGRHEKEFSHVSSVMSATEAEEVGVEHLLREIQDVSLSTLSTEVRRKLTGLRGLSSRLASIGDYLRSVRDGKIPINQEILRNLQLMLNLLPNVLRTQFTEAVHQTQNDMMLSVYVATLLRSVLSLDALLENKIENKRLEAESSSEEKKQVSTEEGKKKSEDSKKKKSTSSK